MLFLQVNKTDFYIINRRIHGCLKTWILFLVLTGISTREINFTSPHMYVLFSMYGTACLGTNLKTIKLSTFKREKHAGLMKTYYFSGEMLLQNFVM